MTRPRLYLSVDTHHDFLSAIEFGHVDDGQRADAWDVVNDTVGFLSDLETGRGIGFHVDSYSTFDPQTFEYDELWVGDRYDVPQMGLFNATAGEICLAARPFLGGQPTLNRVYFNSAVENGEGTDPVAAATDWQLCLECGDLMAHYGLGYSLLDIGDLHGAHRHLKAYTEISPRNAWAWCFLGKACMALGQTAEARAALQRAIELEQSGSFETDADALLEEIDGGGSHAAH